MIWINKSFNSSAISVGGFPDKAPLADEDVLDIWQYIAQSNIEAADRLLEKFDQKCQLLGNNPNKRAKA